MHDATDASVNDNPGDGQVDFEITATPARQGRTKLTVLQAGQMRHRDTFDLSNAERRQLFCRKVAKKLQVSVEAVDQELLRILQQAESLPAGAEGNCVQGEQAEEDRPSDAQIMIAMVSPDQLFHTSDGTPFATIVVNGRPEAVPVRSGLFRQWLIRNFDTLRQRPPSMDGVTQAITCLEARACIDGPTNEVHIRTAAVPATGGPAAVYYIDLCDPAGSVVRVTPEGWDIVTAPPVHFYRTGAMHALPTPTGGGDLALLWDLVNLPEPRQRRLFLAWLLTVLRGLGPFPIVAISGEQGSAKTALMRIARLLTDPHEVVERDLPENIRDLMISAANTRLLSFDNVSFLSEKMSDVLCRLATGASFATRRLYTDLDESIVKAQRPVILNGIPDVASQGDLLDRALLLRLPTIPADERIPEQVLWAQFHERRPSIFGALLDCMVRALQIEPDVPRENLPRMADFTVWGEAVCQAAGDEPGEFLEAYRVSREDAAEIALESSQVAVALLALLAERTHWTGEAHELLEQLSDYAPRPISQVRGWPQTPRGMSAAVTRLTPALRAKGIEVVHRRETSQARRRIIEIGPADPEPGGIEGQAA